MCGRERFSSLSFIAVLILLITLIFINTVQAQNYAGYNPPSKCMTYYMPIVDPYMYAWSESTRFFCNGVDTEVTYRYGEVVYELVPPVPPADPIVVQEIADKLCAQVMQGGVVDVRSDALKEQGCCPPQLNGFCTPHTMGKAPQNSACDFGSSANLKSGNLHYSQDVGGLTLHYNSISTEGNPGHPLGYKWTHQYNHKITALSDNVNLTLKEGDGSIIYYRLSGGVYYPSDNSGESSSIVKNADGTYMRTAKDGMVYNYDMAGKLTTVIDKNGNTTSLTYSNYYNQFYLSAITDKNGRTTTLTSPNGQRITAITDPGGRTYKLAYEDRYLFILTSITDPEGNVWSFTYGGLDGRYMLSRTDPSNKTTTYTYPEYESKVLSATDPEGKIRRMNYLSLGNSTFTEKDGSVWTYKYDPVYAVKTEKTDPLGNTTRYTYDSKRNLISTIEPNGATTSHTYDAAGNLTSTTDPLGHTTNYTYNSQNLVTSVTDPKGNTTQYGYDANGNLTSITAPGVAVTRYMYDARGNITSITDPLNKTTALAYDARNNLTSITDPLGKTTVMTYDNAGNMLTRTDPSGHTATFQYNSLNQLIKVTDPKGYVTQFTYDFNGNRLTATDANGRVTRHLYNYRDQLAQITDALNNITNLSYAGAGCGTCTGVDKLTAVTDAKLQTTAFEYDPAGNLVRETSPLGRVTAYAYDGKGNLITKTKPDGRTIAYSYDLNNRLIGKLYPDGAVAAFQYNDNGNMTYAGNGSIAYSFAYDENNRVTGITDSNGRTIRYAYDATGNRISMTAPDNSITSYIYDALNRISGITDSSGSHVFTYNAEGRRATLTYPNTVKATYTYDSNDNLTRVAHAKGKTAIATVSYAYDKVNNRLKRTDKTAVAYTYDDIYRLKTSSRGETYNYDPVGNRTTGPTSGTTYGYDADNEMIAKTGAGYAYDYNGNLTGRTEGATTASYTYDDEDRLIGVTSGAGLIAYAYDPFGRRIGKNVNGTITNYVYDHQNILAEYDGGSNLKARYTQGINIDEPLAIKQGASTYYYHADGLGSVVNLTSTQGKSVQTYAYDSFGNVTPTGSVKQPFAFTGREYDQETGLYYYRARYYDPKVGRFITRDPIGFRGGINQYTYVRNNPVKWNDPFGLYGPDVHGSDTYIIGIQEGLSPETALLIAWADNNTDEKYDPLSSYNNRANWHFITLQRVNALIINALSSCEPRMFGEALHPLQDYYSHTAQGYGPIFGHTYAVGGPDIPANNPDLYNQMLSATTSAMKQFKDKCSCSK